MQSIKLAVHGYLICQAFFFVSTWLDSGPATAGETKNIVWPGSNANNVSHVSKVIMSSK